MAQPARAMTRICAWQVGSWWRTRTPGSPSRSLERCRSSSKMSMGLVVQGVNQRGRMATEASTSAWADSWRNVWCEIGTLGGLGDNFSVRKVKSHTTLEAVLAGIIAADDRAGNDLANAAC